MAFTTETILAKQRMAAKDKKVKEDKKVGIIFAMQCEYDKFNPFTAEIDKAEVEISGVGKVNAAIAAYRLIHEKNCTIILSVGFAGGIAENGIKKGDVVIADSATYGDVWCGEGTNFGQIDGMPEDFDCKVSDTAYKIAKDIISYKNQIRIGKVATCDRFVTDKKEIIKHFPSTFAVDMESAAIAQVCHMNNVEFSSVKIISDVIGEKEQFEQYKSSAKFV